jgi:hypothetical protein
MQATSIRAVPTLPACEQSIRFFMRRAKIKCGSTIRLTHYATKKNLHTHLHVAPMSGQQEVSAFGNDGEGDNGVCIVAA